MTITHTVYYWVQRGDKQLAGKIQGDWHSKAAAAIDISQYLAMNDQHSNHGIVTVADANGDVVVFFDEYIEAVDRSAGDYADEMDALRHGSGFPDQVVSIHVLEADQDGYAMQAGVQMPYEQAKTLVFLDSCWNFSSSANADCPELDI